MQAANRHFAAVVWDSKYRDYVKIARMGALWREVDGNRFWFAGGVQAESSYRLIYYDESRDELVLYQSDPQQLREELQSVPASPTVMEAMTHAIDTAMISKDKMKDVSQLKSAHSNTDLC